MPEILKKSPKIEDQFRAIQIFKTMRSEFYFRLGKGNSAESSQSKFIVPIYLKYSCLKGKGSSAFI